MDDSGFSLIELLVVIAIFSIGLSIAIPAFTSVGKRNIVKLDARRIKDSLYKARMKAVQLNKSIIFEIDDDNESYSTTVIYTDEIVETYKFKNIDLQLDGTSSVIWNSKGYASSAFTISVLNDSGQYNVIVSSAGNIKIEKP